MRDITDTAIIGGTGFDELLALDIAHHENIKTPYGEPSAPIALGKINARDFAFLPRHGAKHNFLPHQINYQANIWALKQIGVQKIISLSAVGSIANELSPGAIVIPHQIIDYTWSRAHTFANADGQVGHIDFSNPYSEALRVAILHAAVASSIEVKDTGVYAATQGPRLETAAEIDRMERDGATIVGMTGMPEACLARELEIEYAVIAMVANRGAGRSDDDISFESIANNLKVAGAKAVEIIKNL